MGPLALTDIRQAFVLKPSEDELCLVALCIDITGLEQRPRKRMEHHQAVQKSCAAALAPRYGARAEHRDDPSPFSTQPVALSLPV